MDLKSSVEKSIKEVPYQTGACFLLSIDQIQYLINLHLEKHGLHIPSNEAIEFISTIPTSSINIPYVGLYQEYCAYVKSSPLSAIDFKKIMIGNGFKLTQVKMPHGQGYKHYWNPPPFIPVSP